VNGQETGKEVSNVISIHQQKRLFTLEEARELLPVVKRVTKAAHDEISRMTTLLAAQKESAKKTELEEEVQARFRGWIDNVKRLGCEAKGAWLVDFDSGEGYYCWSFPEPTLEHFHGYQEGFGGRTRIQ